MTKKNKKTLPSYLSRKQLRFVALGLFCVLGSFVLGIETVGDVHPFQATVAQESDQMSGQVPSGMQGDFNCNGIRNEIEDAMIPIEVALGYSMASDCQREASRTGRMPNLDDALRVLRSIQRSQP